jgi:long-chain acyl-CoA synthetase
MHRNYTANVEQASATLPIPEWYTSLLLLPWDHAFAHTAGIYTLMKNGASMASVKPGKTMLETLKNVPVNIRETRPTFLLSVPALAKNFRKNIEKGIKEKGPGVEKLFKKALDLAYEYNGIGWDQGRNASLAMKLQYKLFDFLIFRKIRANFGGRLQFFIGGGALLDIELQRFFYAIGIPMYQGYGLTEAAPIISANVPARHKLGSSGSIIPNLEVKICDGQGNELPIGHHGEIVVRGENVMLGYWKNEKATRETLRDGWLYTGDLGYLDSDNFLYVLGRAKSLLISHDGEKYSPEGIEEAIVGNSRTIDQVMLYNNQSPYTVALVVPNKDVVLNYLKERNLSAQTEEGQDAALRLIESEIGQFKAGGAFAGEFPERWLPAAVAVLGEGFTEQNQFLNSTLKMVRGKITEFYRDRIDYIFTAEGKDICNPQNRMIIKRTG